MEMTGHIWKALLINPKDNVAVVLEDIPSGALVTVLGSDPASFPATARQQIPFAHKIAITVIERGGPVMKYGVPVALARTRILAGDWVHEHNAKSYLAKREGDQ